jgi:hypothetical protein
MLTNQTSTAGPKKAPMGPVPLRCTANRPIRIPTTMAGRMSPCTLGAATAMPSTALNTEIAGVMMPSAKSSAEPTRPTNRSTRPVRAP